jgi:hypothetical protein
VETKHFFHRPWDSAPLARYPVRGFRSTAIAELDRQVSFHAEIARCQNECGASYCVSLADPWSGPLEIRNRNLSDETNGQAPSQGGGEFAQHLTNQNDVKLRGTHVRIRMWDELAGHVNNELFELCKIRDAGKALVSFFGSSRRVDFSVFLFKLGRP